MDFAQKAIEEGKREYNGALQHKPPINIVTATFLDPRRYYKYFIVWGFLSLLSLFQWLQFLFVKRKSMIWETKLMKWLKRIIGKQVDVNTEFSWAAFKEDYLPHSIDAMLDDVQKKKKFITPLTIMGASYIKIPNIVFTDFKGKVDPTKIARNENPKESAKQMVEALKSPKDLDVDYQTLEATTKPAWKSRFILAPEKLPTREEVEEFLGNDPIMQIYDDESEQEGEFEPYIFEEFLKEIEPQIPKYSEKEKTKIILHEIERDREEIIRNALLKRK